jgi:outer membrane protein
MKRIFQVVFALLTLGTVNTVFAQKFGYVDTQELLMTMPERAGAEQQLQNYAKELEAQLKTMSGEWEAKVSDYQSKSATMTDAIKRTKEKEIVDLEGRIKEFQSSAQDEIERKEKELLQPMIEKAKKAIEEIAKEQKFTYVFDSSVGVLLFKPDGDDILPLVKKKLNIK